MNKLNGIKKFLSWKVPLYFLFIVVFVICLIKLISDMTKGKEYSKSYSIVKYIEQVNATVFLNVGIETIETQENNTTIPWTKTGIPFTEKKKIIILNYQAKLGIKKPVKIDKVNDNKYKISIPKYEVIGVELDSKAPYQLYDSSGALLSNSTEDVDTGKLVINRLSTKKQEMYLAKYKGQMNDSAKSYYKTLFQGINKEAKLEFNFEW